MQLLRERKEEKKKKKDYPKPWVIFLPKTPLISARNGKEDEDLCVLCVVRERVAKILKKREFWQLKKKETKGRERELGKRRGKEGKIREKE